MNQLEALRWILDHPNRPGALQGPRTRLGNNIVVQHPVGATVEADTNPLEPGETLIGAVGGGNVPHVKACASAARRVAYHYRDHREEVDFIPKDPDRNAKEQASSYASQRQSGDPSWVDSEQRQEGYWPYRYEPSPEAQKWILECKTTLLDQVYRNAPYQDLNIDGPTVLVAKSLLREHSNIVNTRKPLAAVSLGYKNAVLLKLTSKEFADLQKDWKDLPRYQAVYAFEPKAYTGQWDLTKLLADPDIQELVEHSLQNEQDIDLDTIIEVIARHAT